LWRSIAATLVIELGLLAGGLAIYLRTTRARDAIGRWGLWAMIALLTLIFLAGFSGSPPPSERALAVTTLGLWLFVPWGWWVDRHREAVSW
jgi:predicted membrane metal-binding protein